MTASPHYDDGPHPIKLAVIELNKRVDCADLAERLGWPREGWGKGSPEAYDHRAEETLGRIDLYMLAAMGVAYITLP